MALWLALVCLLAFFNGLFTLAPLDKTEALQIGIAETMQRLHHWDVPFWNEHVYADKPPLPYWLDGLIWSHAGLVPELARLASAIAATAGVAWLSWLFDRCCRQELTQQQAWEQTALAGSLLALTPGWIAFGRTAVHDIYLALAVLWAMGSYALCFGLANRRGRPLVGALAIGLSCGFGFLAKGLLGIGLPVLIIAVDAWLKPATRQQLLRPAVAALFCMGLLTVISPWLAALIHERQWTYLQGFLGFSHLQRATQAVDGHDQPVLFYLPVLLGLLCPWWPLLWPACRQLWQQRRHWSDGEGGSQRLQQLAALWLVVGMALFTAIPTKLPGYVLPLLPAAVLLIAATPKQPRWCLRLVALQLALLSVAVLLGLLGSHLDLLGGYGQLLSATPAGTIWIAFGGILALATAVYGGWRAKANRQLQVLLISMLLLTSCLPALAKPYRQLEQKPILELARAAERLHGNAGVLYVLGRPRYSVVTSAKLPTIFGSPLKPASPRPISSYENWKRHVDDAEALVLGRCNAMQGLELDQDSQLTTLAQRGRYCLARLRREAGEP